MGIFGQGVNKGAYQGELICPFVIEIYNPETHMRERVDCNSKAIRFVENVTQYRLRYRCRKCGNTFQYDISGYHNVNPYAPYRKGKIWSKIEKGLDDIRRMQMLDKMSREARLRESQNKGVIL
jgi:hypothetical protein